VVVCWQDGASPPEGLLGCSQGTSKKWLGFSCVTGMSAHQPLRFLSSAAAVSPLAAGAQQPEMVRRIGVLRPEFIDPKNRPKWPGARR
jgi:hypothetical protein